MAVICLIVAIVFLFVDRMEYEGVNTKRFSAISGRRILKATGDL